MEHYSALYSRESTISDSTMEATKSLSTMEELDEMPSLEEFSLKRIRFTNG